MGKEKCQYCGKEFSFEKRRLKGTTPPTRFEDIKREYCCQRCKRLIFCPTCIEKKDYNKLEPENINEKYFGYCKKCKIYVCAFCGKARVNIKEKEVYTKDLCVNCKDISNSIIICPRCKHLTQREKQLCTNCKKPVVIRLEDYKWKIVK